MKQLQLKDFLSYRFLSSPAWAPDGKHAAFVVSACNEDENCYESRLWLFDGSLRQMTDLGKENSFLWEDETHILFPAVRSAAEQKRSKEKEQFTSYYRLDITGGEATHAFTLPFAVQTLKHVSGSVYAAIGATDALHPDYYRMNSEERAAVAREAEENKDYEVFDESPFWLNGGGVINKRRSSLFLVDTASMEIQKVTEPLFNLDNLLILDNQILFTGSSYESKAPVKGYQLFSLDLSTRQAQLICENPDFYLGQMYSVGNQVWVQAYTGQRYGLNENTSIYRLDPATGALDLLRQEEYNFYNSVGSDCRLGGGDSSAVRDGKLYHLTTREGSCFLHVLDETGADSPVMTAEGSMDAIAVSENTDQILFVGMYENQLQELYTYNLSTGAMTQVSHFNQKALEGIYVADPLPLSVRSSGLEIGGWVLLPRDYDPSRKYPAVLDIHGGPKTVYGPVFCHEMQLWANMGYFVFFCNPKGGDGRDNEFADIRGHYGETDYRNLMDFTDAVLEAYPQIDREKVCVTGGSYGGFMTNWIIGHTGRFVCAASQRSISNWFSFYGVSDIGPYFADDQCGCNPYTDPEKVWKLSPMRYAPQVTTPTLFIHSDEDYRCPLSEGLQMYTALVEHGVPARLCLFHGENHELSRSGKPLHRVRRLTEITNWFEKYAK